MPLPNDVQPGTAHFMHSFITKQITMFAGIVYVCVVQRGVLIVMVTRFGYARIALSKLLSEVGKIGTHCKCSARLSHTIG
jgi:hypothetical protein